MAQVLPAARHIRALGGATLNRPVSASSRGWTRYGCPLWTM